MVKLYFSSLGSAELALPSREDMQALPRLNSHIKPLIYVAFTNNIEPIFMYPR